MNINCVIIDDEPLAVELLKSYVEKTPFLHLQGSYSSAVEALPGIVEKNPDLIFLDVQMPEVSGISFAKSLPKDCMIIFTTAFDQYAAESYHFNTVDYLLKPIAYSDFLKAATKANSILSQKYMEVSPLASEKHPTIWVRSENKYVHVELSNLAYIEGVKDYVNFHFANHAKPILCYLRLKTLEDQLPKEFVRVHKSYIVNTDHINYIERGFVVVTGDRLPIGGLYKDELMKKVEGDNFIGY